jgi:cob(I)alamin adenosyltransferase
MPDTFYTRKGDFGTTGLFSGERVEKIDLRVEANGAIDELNAAIGVAKVHSSERVASILQEVQERMFFISNEIATIDESLAIRVATLEDTEHLEAIIAELSEELPPATSFVIFGGTKSAAFLHVARAICRRAERRVLRLLAESPVNHNVITYLNRLSSLLFELARYANIVEGDGDLLISRDGTSIQRRE